MVEDGTFGVLETASCVKFGAASLAGGRLKMGGQCSVSGGVRDRIWPPLLPFLASEMAFERALLSCNTPSTGALLGVSGFVCGGGFGSQASTTSTLSVCGVFGCNDSTGSVGKIAPVVEMSSVSTLSNGMRSGKVISVKSGRGIAAADGGGDGEDR